MRRVRFWKWGSIPPRPVTEPLAEECEAFLAGRLGEIFPGRSVPKPPWVWLNQLAHGDHAQVESAARASRPRRRRRRRRRVATSPHTWPEAIGAVAQELLWFAGDDPSELRRLQMGLVDLELDLSKERPGIWLTPDMLMRRGLDALWADLGDAEKGRVED